LIEETVFQLDPQSFESLEMHPSGLGTAILHGHVHDSPLLLPLFEASFAASFSVLSSGLEKYWNIIHHRGRQRNMNGKGEGGRHVAL
jgi:hypothetical protein